MTEILQLIESLRRHAKNFPSEKESCMKTTQWLEKYWEFAFVKENLDGHITGSMMITNPERTKVLLMLHKKFQRWQQFGGHCDGQHDVKNVAIREFQEESGVSIVPEMIWDIFMVDVHDIPIDSKWRPPHFHFDIMYLGIIPENTILSRQELEVDDIWWFDIDGIEKYVEKDMLWRVRKIQSF